LFEEGAVVTMKIRIDLAFLASIVVLATAMPLGAQTVFLPPRASVNGPSGFASLYASQGEGHLFFGAKVSYGRRGVDVSIAPGAHPGFDLNVVDRTVAMIVARYRLKRSSPSPPQPTKLQPAETIPAAPPRLPG
jgi:hypothetical protein